MASLHIFLILVVCFGILNQTHGQEDCVPNGVQILQLYSNATLMWHMNPDEPCEITEFEVDIVGDREDEFHFKVTENFVDLSFMEICEEWRFTVTPMSYDVIGFARTLTEYIPLPPSADLSLSYFNASSLGERDVLLEWDLVSHIHGDCSLHYRLSIEDEELGITQDVYVQGNSLHLTFLSPCVPYQLGIRAINRAQPTIEGPQRMTEIDIPSKPQIAPTLTSIDIQVTSISFTWALEGGTNRCPLKAIYADGGNYFNVSVSLQNSLDPTPVPLQLRSLRPNTMYYIRVYVENSGGVSAAFPIGVQTLELSPS